MKTIGWVENFFLSYSLFVWLQQIKKLQRICYFGILCIMTQQVYYLALNNSSPLNVFGICVKTVSQLIIDIK